LTSLLPKQVKMLDILMSEVFDAALALIDEVNDGSVDDYLERCPYLAAAFCSEVGAVDLLWRESMGGEAQPAFGAVSIGSDESFPLSDRFIPAAASYIAAMLVLEENEALYEKLYGRYSDLISGICAEIPGASEKIVEVYGIY